MSTDLRDDADAPVLVRNVSKSFRLRQGWTNLLRTTERTTALDAINLTVHPGEVFGLLGPNGAGKTTLIKILCGLVIPDSGTVRMAGIDIHDDDPDAHRTVGVVYGDERSFHWRLSVRENLEFFARLYGMDPTKSRHRIDELIDLVGLGHAGDQRMLAFSSGMKQRASIARGLLHDPSVVLMDEPTRMLDPVGSHDLHAFVRDRIAADGRTVLVATNLMTEAETLCDRLLLIDRGRAVMTGTVAEFRNEIDPVLTYRFVATGSVPPEASLAAIPGVASVGVTSSRSGVYEISVATTSGSMALPAVLRALLEAHLDLISIEREEASLDDIFRQVVGGRRPTEAVA